MDIVETLAAELHRQYRAAEKAMNRVYVKHTDTRLHHDHGWSNCLKQSYFRKRAKEIIRRSQCTDPSTLGEAEQALEAMVLKRRLIVGLEV